MEIIYKYSEKEFISAMNQIQDSRRVIFDIALAIVLLIYGCYSLMNDSNPIIVSFIIVISLLFLFITLARTLIAPRIVYRREPKYKEEYILVFNEDEILFSAGGLKSTIPWSYYEDMKETKDFIYLMYGKKSYSIIPKRVFFNNEELNKFKMLISSKIKMKV